MSKKGVIGVLSAILIAIAAFGIYRYFHPTPLGLLRQMIRNLGRVESFKADMTTNLDGTVSIGGIEAELELNSDIGMESALKEGISHQKGTLKVSAIGLSVDAPIESYTQSEGTKTTTYSSTNGGKWVKSVVDSASTSETTGEQGQQEEQQNADIDVDSKAVIGLFQKIMSGEVKAELAKETETICGKEAFRMDITIAGDVLQDILKIIIQAMGERAQIPDDLDLTNTTTVLVLHIYKDSRLPASLRIDCTELGNALIRSFLKTDGIEGRADRFTFEIVVPEYNTVDSIRIPEEVISGAVDSEQANILDLLIPGMQ